VIPDAGLAEILLEHDLPTVALVIESGDEGGGVADNHDLRSFRRLRNQTRQ
jgi:hypothetical protein